MKLLVFGASGKTGHELVRRALLQGHEVTAFVRPTSDVSALSESVRILKGQLYDEEILIHMLAGCDAAVSALGAAHPMKYDPVLVQGMRHLCAAMEHVGSGRLIYLSPLTLRDSRSDSGFVLHHIAPLLLRTEIRGHAERETIIRSSKVDWTIVRAPFLTMGPHTGTYKVGESIVYSGFLPKLSRADIAEAMLNLTTHNRSRRIVRVLPVQ